VRWKSFLHTQKCCARERSKGERKSAGLPLFPRPAISWCQGPTVSLLLNVNLLALTGNNLGHAPISRDFARHAHHDGGCSADLGSEDSTRCDL
jgi:hypothetical protein